MPPSAQRTDAEPLSARGMEFCNKHARNSDCTSGLDSAVVVKLCRSGFHKRADRAAKSAAVFDINNKWYRHGTYVMSCANLEEGLMNLPYICLVCPEQNLNPCDRAGIQLPPPKERQQGPI